MADQSAVVCCEGGTKAGETDRINEVVKEAAAFAIRLSMDSLEMIKKGNGKLCIELN